MTLSAACRALMLLTTAVAAAVPAHADIKAFNAAVRAGDYATAATEVPMESFGEKVADTLKTWTLKPAKGANLDGCRLNSPNHVYKVIFYVG